MSNNSPVVSSATPFWRDIRVLRWVFQLALLALVILGLYLLSRNLVLSLRDLGLDLSFDFLTRRTGFRISEGPAFEASQPIWQAYLVGIVNTLRATVVGILLATAVGLLAGVSRLSSNWLVRRVATLYVETLQNIPLLVQLFFWLAVLSVLPRPRRDEILIIGGEGFLPPLAYLSRRAWEVPALLPTASFGAWMLFVGAGALIGAGLWWWRIRQAEREQKPATGQFWLATGALAALSLIGFFVVPGRPLMIELPVIEGEGVIVNFSAGTSLTAGFLALVLGLTFYTATFIAEAVRAGIQSVPAGQIEAAKAIGLKAGQRLRLIILPQALRVIIPPLINNYLNLTKNSSLAIAVGYPDLFNVSTTIGNQTGQNVQIVLILMGTYLSFSLIISFVLNVYNRRIQFAER